MTKRAGIRASDINTTIHALQKHGITPTALDAMPDGTLRWHFTQPSETGQTALEKEWAAFEAKHGHG